MPAEEDNSGSDVEAEEEETVFKFGDSDLSDVIFDVDGKEFHCNKIILASKSEYFKALFFSDFKEKDQERITIEAEAIPFKRLMEIIYNGYIQNAKEILLGNYFEKLGISFQEYNKSLWQMVHGLFALADRFLLTDVVRDSFEMTLIRFDRECPYKKSTCKLCGVKLLLSLCFKMQEYTKINVSSRSTIDAVLGYFSGDIQMPVEAMQYLLRRN